MNDKSLAIALYALLEREGAVSIPQIATLLGSDEETIWRLLEQLVFAYDAVDIRLELDASHAFLLDASKHTTLRLNAAEASALLDALEAYGYDQDSSLARRLMQTKALVDGVEEADARRFSTASRGVSANVAQQLAAAADGEGNLVVEIDYQKEGDAHPQMRRIEPYALIGDGDHSLLEAFDLDRGAWRTFRLDRIRAVRATGERFIRRKRDLEQAPAEAMLRFAPGCKPSDWPGLKFTRTLSDGSTEATIPWYGSMWLPKRIVALFGAAEPLDPPALREACTRCAAQLLDPVRR